MRAILLTFLILIVVPIANADDVIGKLAIGDPVPEFLGEDLDGNEIRASDHLGKVMVISFWATWCPPCQKELPIIDNLQRLAGKDRLSVIAVNYGEKRRTFRRFVNRLGEANLTFSHDPKMKIGKDDFGVEGIPHMVMVDHEGKVAVVQSGYGDATINKIADEVNALFRKQASSS